MLTMTCNQCGNNLDDGGGYPSFRIKLSVERRPNKGGFEYAVALNPPFKVREAHFCGAKCLAEFVLDPANSPSGFKLNVAAGGWRLGDGRQPLNDLVAWLEAVHATDEQTARDAIYGGEDEGEWLYFNGHLMRRSTDEDNWITELEGHSTAGNHAERQDPRAALARIDAERMLLRLHVRYDLRPIPGFTGGPMCRACTEGEEPNHSEGASWSAWPCPTLRVLAWGYRHRDGYRPEWTPEGADTYA